MKTSYQKAKELIKNFLLNMIFFCLLTHFSHLLSLLSVPANGRCVFLHYVNTIMLGVNVHSVFTMKPSLADIFMCAYVYVHVDMHMSSCT